MTEDITGASVQETLRTILEQRGEGVKVKGDSRTAEVDPRAGIDCEGRRRDVPRRRSGPLCHVSHALLGVAGGGRVFAVGAIAVGVHIGGQGRAESICGGERGHASELAAFVVGSGGRCGRRGEGVHDGQKGSGGSFRERDRAVATTAVLR